MTVTDEDIIEALEAAYEEGETIRFGGVPAEEVAERTPLTTSTVRKRLAHLSNVGEIEQVWGIGSVRPRRSYLP